MGRHSAPDDDEDLGDRAAAASSAPVATMPRGRHVAQEPDEQSAGASLAEQPTAPLEPALDGAPVAGGEPAAGHAPAVPVESVAAPDEGEDDDGTAGDFEALIGFAAQPAGPLDGDADAGLAAGDGAQTTVPVGPLHTSPSTPDELARTAPEPKGAGGTRADLRLLRAHPSLRAQCAAALVAPFVVFIVVLVVIGRLDRFVLWVWIPIVVAGVAVGACLDAAHKRWR